MEHMVGPAKVAGFTPWPDEVSERYRELGYWQGRTLGEILDSSVATHRDRIALIGPGQRLTYEELGRAVDRLAGRLAERGLRRGDRMVVQLPSSTTFVTLFVSLMKIGVAPVMALPPHRETEITYLAEAASATAYAAPRVHRGFDHRELADALRVRGAVRSVFYDGEAVGGGISLAAMLEPGGAEPMEPVGTAPSASDIALFLLSGGTTGLPKLIARTHDDYACNARVSASVCGFDADTRYLVSLPISHNFPLGSPGVLGTLMAGGTVVIPASPEPDELFRTIEAERVTVTSVVPAMAIRWLEEPSLPTRDLSSLRVLQVGGARLNPEVARRVEPTLGCRLQQVFGMAEGLLNYTRLDDPDAVIEGTQGRPCTPDDEIVVVDPDGNPVADGVAGELWTRGPYTIRGYFDAEEHNRVAFTADGFYRTGDVVRRTPEGNLVVEGRVKDMINRGGEKISAEEVEDLILSHPAVSNVAVVAMPDPVLGERACAYVVVRAGASLTFEELCDHLRARQIATFKLPERLEVVDALPLTDVGKVSKSVLRKDIAAKLARVDASSEPSTG
jgi:2,3-dihydroxybenzoate-AMP ligase